MRGSRIGVQASVARAKPSSRRRATIRSASGPSAPRWPVASRPRITGGRTTSPTTTSSSRRFERLRCGRPPPPPAASPSPEKRPKLDYGPDAVVAAGEASLLLGDVVALPGHDERRLRPRRHIFLDKPRRPWTSCASVDIDRGEVTRVLAWPHGMPGLSTQYIRDLVFSFDPYQAEGLVFDVAGGAPAFVLPKCGPARLNPFAAHDGVMIGVPLPGGYPAAFTAGADEVIRCWDLRAAVVARVRIAR